MIQLVVQLIVMLLGYAFSAVCLWCIFAKAGKRRWKSLIPIYKWYVLCHVAGWSGWELILTAVISVLRLLLCASLWDAASSDGSVLAFVFLVLAAVPYEGLVYSLLLSMRLGRCFGKSLGFALGLFLVPVVFVPILAFGRSQYSRPARVKPPAFGPAFCAVFKRELGGYFATPLAYVFLVVFVAGSAYLAFVKGGFYKARQADMQVFFRYMPVLFILIVPATAMRLWAEERKIGSIELLFTLPVTVPQAVLGKFFAAWIFLAIALALTFPMVWTVYFLGEPDPGPIATGYLASWLMAGAYLAIGCFFSAISKNQVIAFVLTVVACAVFAYSDDPSAQAFLRDVLGGFMMKTVGRIPQITWLSFRRHFESAVKGLLRFQDVSYFVLLIVGWIAACTVILDDRKAA